MHRTANFRFYVLLWYCKYRIKKSPVSIVVTALDFKYKGWIIKEKLSCNENGVKLLNSIALTQHSGVSERWKQLLVYPTCYSNILSAFKCKLVLPVLSSVFPLLKTDLYMFKPHTYMYNNRFIRASVYLKHKRRCIKTELSSVYAQALTYRIFICFVYLCWLMVLFKCLLKPTCTKSD